MYFYYSLEYLKKFNYHNVRYSLNFFYIQKSYERLDLKIYFLPNYINSPSGMKIEEWRKIITMFD